MFTKFESISLLQFHDLPMCCYPTSLVGCVCVQRHSVDKLHQQVASLIYCHLLDTPGYCNSGFDFDSFNYHGEVFCCITRKCLKAIPDNPEKPHLCAIMKANVANICSKLGHYNCISGLNKYYYALLSKFVM